MAEHYCSKHATIFFKKGKMKHYAHPIENADGETVGWCNEDAEEVAKLEPQKPEPVPLQEGEPTPEQLRPFDPTRKSIERQTALKASTEIAVAKITTSSKETSLHEILAVAIAFESYLENGATVEKKK